MKLPLNGSVDKIRELFINKYRLSSSLLPFRVVFLIHSIPQRASH